MALSEAVLECDFPDCSRRGKRQVTQYRIDVEDGFVTANLCREHDKPIRELIKALPAHHFTKVVKSHNRSRATSFQMTTIEDIEARKRPPRRS